MLSSKFVSLLTFCGAVSAVQIQGPEFHIDVNQDDGSMCSICQNEKDIQNMDFLDPCGHSFCSSCVDRFHQRNCPMCRVHFTGRRGYQQMEHPEMVSIRHQIYNQTPHYNFPTIDHTAEYFSKNSEDWKDWAEAVRESGVIETLRGDDDGLKSFCIDAIAKEIVKVFDIDLQLTYGQDYFYDDHYQFLERFEIMQRIQTLHESRLWRFIKRLAKRPLGNHNCPGKYLVDEDDELGQEFVNGTIFKAFANFLQDVCDLILVEQ